MAAENICDLQNWTRHKSRALRGRRARLARPDELIERARYLPDRLGGRLGVPSTFYDTDTQALEVA
jgi:hypothetical protein